LSLGAGLSEFRVINTSDETGNVVFAHLKEGFAADDV